MDESDWYNAEVYVRGTNLLAKFSKQSGGVKTDISIIRRMLTTMW